MLLIVLPSLRTFRPFLSVFLNGIWDSTRPTPAFLFYRDPLCSLVASCKILRMWLGLSPWTCCQQPLHVCSSPKMLSSFHLLPRHPSQSASNPVPEFAVLSWHHSWDIHNITQWLEVFHTKNIPHTSPLANEWESICFCFVLFSDSLIYFS